MARACLYDAYMHSWSDNNQPLFPATTITGENTFYRNLIMRIIKLPPAADDLISKIFIFINNAAMAIT